MPTLQEVNDQLKKLRFAGTWLAGSEVKQLPMILGEDEQIVGVIQGTWNRQNGLLVATQTRLIFVDKGLARLAVKDFAFAVRLTAPSAGHHQPSDER